MKKTFLLATVILIFSCDNRTTDIRYYPADPKASDKNSEVIELETTKLNFGEITDKIGILEENNTGHLTVEFKDGKVIKRVKPYIFGIGLYKTKNVLKIKSDSVYMDDGYQIENLKPLLKRHYLNKGENPKYSVSPEKAIVEVALDPNQNGKEIREVLVRLTQAFDEVNSEVKDSLELNVFFNYLDLEVPNVPPPPLPEENNGEY